MANLFPIHIDHTLWILDIIVIAIIVPLVIASGVLLVTDPHGDARLLVDYFTNVGFLLSLIFVLAGSCLKRSYSLVKRGIN